MIEKRLCEIYSNTQRERERERERVRDPKSHFGTLCNIYFHKPNSFENSCYIPPALYGPEATLYDYYINKFAKWNLLKNFEI